jgi:hypothetical protein
MIDIIFGCCWWKMKSKGKDRLLYTMMIIIRRSIWLLLSVYTTYITMKKRAIALGQFLIVPSTIYIGAHLIYVYTSSWNISPIYISDENGLSSSHIGYKRTNIYEERKKKPTSFCQTIQVGCCRDSPAESDEPLEFHAFFFTQ